MGVEVEYPIVIELDNAGEIFLANNKALGQRTKHIDTHYHFTREYVEDGIIKIRYVRTDDNTSDVMTKNTARKTFWKHCEKFMEYINVNNLTRSGKYESKNRGDVNRK